VSAALALARAEAAGIQFHLAADGVVRMAATAAPPSELLGELQRWRDDVAYLLALREGLVAGRGAPAPKLLTGPLAGQRPEEWWRLPYGPERGEAFAAARVAECACRCCAGRNWWFGEGAQASPRCMTCHPPPPGLLFGEMTT
jgi:hypothetical protein